MLETALRHLVNQRHDNWVEFLGELQLQFNNTPNASTGLCPNEVILGARLRDCGDIWNSPQSLDIDRHGAEFATRMANIRSEALDSIAFASYARRRTSTNGILGCRRLRLVTS